MKTIKLNREMLRDAIAACMARDLDPTDLPRELELELFGSEIDEEEAS